MISVPLIFNNDQVKFFFPTVVYNLTNPFHSKIFNFDVFDSSIKSIKIYKFISDSDSISYNCAGSFFTDKVHAQSLTGDLCIIKSNKLKRLNGKDPKFCKKLADDFASAEDNILEDIDICITSWSQKKA